MRRYYEIPIAFRSSIVHESAFAALAPLMTPIEFSFRGYLSSKKYAKLCLMPCVSMRYIIFLNL